MPQPVKISDALLNGAREAAGDAGRSVAAQVEHWAWVGRAVEGSLTGTDLVRLKRVAQQGPAVIDEEAALRDRLAEALRQAATTGGHPALASQLARTSVGPRYGADPAFPGYLVRVDDVGQRTVGRWVDGEFVALELQSAREPDGPSARAR